MVALFDDIAVFHYQDDISALDGGESVGYDKAGAAFHHRGKCILDLDLGTGIDGGGCLIEDQHGRQAQHYSGNASELFLSLGQAASVLGDHGVIPLGQAFNEAVGMGSLRRPDDLLFCGIRLTHADIVTDGAGTQPGLL